MFCGDIVESLNYVFKDNFLTTSSRGGGRKTTKDEKDEATAEPSQGAREGSSCAVVTTAHRQRWTGAASALYGRRRPSVWLQGVGTAACPAVSRRPGRAGRTERWSDPITSGCAMPRAQMLSRRDHGRRGLFTRKVSTGCRDWWSVGLMSSTPPAVAL